MTEPEVPDFGVLFPFKGRGCSPIGELVTGAARGNGNATRPRGPERRVDSTTPAALVRPVATDMVCLHSRSVDRAFDATKNALLFEGRSVATLDASLTLPVTDFAARLSLLGKVASHRLLRWEVLTVHDRFQAGHPDARVLTVDGGYQALTRELGLSTKCEPEVQALVQAQAALRFELPDGSHGNLIAYEWRKESRRRRARLRITVGPQLAPHYSPTLPLAADRKLVPMLRSEPPLHGAPLLHGAQLTMQLALLVEMRSRARELAKEGGIVLSPSDWVILGDRAGIPRTRTMVLAVRDTWLNGSSRAAPLLERVGPDRYTLSEHHRVEREFLLQGGADELAAQKAGRRSSRLRFARAT